ncbi:MAG: GspH/FimT family pseudopilin [Planctomycetota bacterium]
MQQRRRSPSGGFTLIELLVTLAIIALLFALILPNLGALVPAARLEGSGKQLRAKIDWVRSEARIRGQPMAIELDLDHSRWRVVLPPDMQLTLDQDPDTLEEYSLIATELEDNVYFAGAGDAKNGIAKKDKYRIRFDEYGFSDDQMVILKLKDDPKQVWALTIRGLTGQTSVEERTDGREPDLTGVGEGAF